VKVLIFFLITLFSNNLHAESDAYYLALAGQHEAGVDGKKGMMAVMVVINNRVKSPLFPNSIKKVIYQKSQFSYIHRAKKPNKLARKVAEEALSILGGRSYWSARAKIGDRVYFNAPSWRGKSITRRFRNSQSDVTIGGHVFH